MHTFAACIQNLRDQQTKFSIAKHRDVSALRDSRLIENLTGRRQWLYKHSRLIGERIGHDVKIRLGQRQKLAECTGMSRNTKHSAAWAVAT